MTITIQLKGGLGNQLFQYAFARAISIRNQQPLSINTHWYVNTPKKMTSRAMLLGYLNLASYNISHSSWPSSSGGINYLLSLLPFTSIIFDDNPNFFNAQLLKREFSKNRNYAFIGYWQSFHYFNQIRELLISEFKPKNSLNDNYSHYYDDIKNQNSIMIHIRRSDFITLKSANSHHGVLHLNYYLKAIELIKNNIDVPHFFIFSDDLEWARNNLPTGLHAIFIHSSKLEDAVVQELYLMTQCKHHIIANSSLSWWGAWLSNHNKESLTICPDHWLKNGKVNLDDLLPSRWKRIPATLL